MITESVIRRFGEKITADGQTAKGFIFPMHHKDAERIKQPLPIGVKNGESYLLISCLPLKESSRVICAGEAFEVCRSTEIRFAGRRSHFEAVLRTMGRAEDV